VTAIRVVGRLDPLFAWDGDSFYAESAFKPGTEVPGALRGAAASVCASPDGRWRLLRDPLGINKLFWVAATDGTIVAASRPIRLVRAGYRFEEIQAFPCGVVADLSDDGSTADSIRPTDWFEPSQGAVDIDAIARRIRSTLTRYLAALAATHPATRVFICLSGGLDSSGIAVLASEHFRDVTAVSFDLKRVQGRASEDRRTAERLAGELRLPLHYVTVTENDLLGKLDLVLAEGVDWRDFNVHAGLVNATIAEAIDANTSGAKKNGSNLVLTGDLGNEFLADYHPERYGGATFYALPRLSPGRLRSHLVRGLDTCHREVGVFSAWNLPLVQSYAVAVDEYMRLPSDFLALADAKQRLCRAIFGDLVPEYVYTRAKTRAQVGDPQGGGVLGVCVDHGIDAAWLRKRFALLHSVTNVAELDRFIRAGRYRASVPPRASDACGSA
jgi:asparagine synthetase B (glutamine-hydrolysing)